MLTGLLCRLSWNEVDMWSLSQESGDYKQGAETELVAKDRSA